MIRETELKAVIEALCANECVSIIGLSNMGKSHLLRELGAPVVRKALVKDQNDDWIFVYVDCNLMPTRSEQALHEIVLRSLISSLRRGSGKAVNLLADELAELYNEVVQPSTPIRSPLAFGDAISKVCEDSGKHLTVAFDEFDDPFEKLDSRAFLNLRAMVDKLSGGLTLVTATERLLSDLRNDPEANEFIELFSHHIQWIGMLNRHDAQKLVTEFAKDDADKLHEDELKFILEQAGGHSGLLISVTDIWRKSSTAGVSASGRKQALAVIAQSLDDNANVRAECVKLWQQLSQNERDGLIALSQSKTASREGRLSLIEKRLIAATDTSDMAVGTLWTAFVKRQTLTRPNQPRGVEVDLEAGSVQIDGREVEALTDLEYKLLLLLYGRLNKIVDKYTIVTNVWGENYLDTVDDARIEKLVSRLRSKLEPNVDEPKYLVTLRGRGYRLTS